MIGDVEDFRIGLEAEFNIAKFHHDCQRLAILAHACQEFLVDFDRAVPYDVLSSTPGSARASWRTVSKVIAVSSLIFPPLLHRVA